MSFFAVQLHLVKTSEQTKTYILALPLAITATPIQSIFLGILDIKEDCKCVAPNIALHLKISSTLLTLARGATGN